MRVEGSASIPLMEARQDRGRPVRTGAERCGSNLQPASMSQPSLEHYSVGGQGMTLCFWSCRLLLLNGGATGFTTMPVLHGAGAQD